jgi:hypothetical protein
MIRTGSGCRRLGVETVPFAVVALTLATRPDERIDTTAKYAVAAELWLSDP